MHVLIINTGGTISSIGTPLAPMSAEDFAQASKTLLQPVFTQAFPDTVIDYETTLTFPESSSGTLDSTNLQPSDWVLIARCILNAYQNYDGFVILHGTDSMDFTGSALPFLLNVFDAQGYGKAVLSKPVIITGSQVPLYEKTKSGTQVNFNTDGYQNLCGAIACAQLGIPEVAVYFDGNLFRGNRVMKVNASAFAAFETPNYPPLANYGIRLTRYPDRVLPGPVSPAVSLDKTSPLSLAQQQLNAIDEVLNQYPVIQLNAFPAPYSPATSDTSATALLGKLIDSAVALSIKGLILQSYGEGNFPSGDPKEAAKGAIYQALSMANEQEVIVVNCTQVLAGTVNDSAYASGAWLPRVGALSGSDMTPMAAFCKTMLLQAAATYQGWTITDIKRLIQLNLAGEVQNVSQLDSRSNDHLNPGQSIMALDGSATLINDPIQGPQLQKTDGTLLWSVPDQLCPGRLIMQNDGNLVLYTADNTACWASGFHDGNGASSVLRISGSYADGSLTLSTYDYSHGMQTSLLYSQNQASEASQNDERIPDHAV